MERSEKGREREKKRERLNSTIYTDKHRRMIIPPMQRMTAISLCMLCTVNIRLP